MKKLILIMFTVLLILSGCGQIDDFTGTDIKDDVEFGKDDYQNITLSANALGMQVLPEIEDNTNGNRFISPTSLYMALAMTYNGADGETKEEIAQVLNTEMEIEDMNRANASLLALLNKDRIDMTLTVANSMWLNGEHEMQDEFAENNQDYFNAEIQQIDVTSGKSVDKINSWVEHATNGKINDMVASPLDPDLVIILLNAVYFNADWQYAFDKKQTNAAPFYMSDGRNVEKQFMKMEKELEYLKTDKFEAVSLPYGEGEMSMTVFLPSEDITLDDFTLSLSSEKWESWKEKFNEELLTLELPKFALDYEVELNDVLKNLGMATAFQQGANFSKIIQEDTELWISLVKQKTFIEVDEKGTEAAAATEVEIVEESASAETKTMVVNRPFFIAITDEQTGAILFMGSIQDPSASK